MYLYKLYTQQDVIIVEFVTLSLSEGPELDAMSVRLDEELMRSHNKRMVLDCHQLQFIASRGLNLVVTLMKLASQHKGGLAVCGLRPKMAQLFRLTHLDRFLIIRDSRAEAIAALVGSPQGK